MPPAVHKLAIRPEQTKLFVDDAWRVFMWKILNHVRKVFPTFVAPFGGDDEAMTKMLMPYLDQGRAMEIECERDLVRYVDIQLFFRFYTHATGDPSEMQKKIGDRRLPAGYRIERVFAYLEQRFADLENGRIPKAFNQ